MITPTPPIELSGSAPHLRTAAVAVPASVLAALGSICPTDTDAAALADCSRDWWPMAMHWALAGEVPQLAAARCTPATTAQVAAVLRICNEAHVPVTTIGGRSAVTGAAVPVFGGVLLDTTALAGVTEIDAESGVVAVRAGTFGPDLESALNEHLLSVGHFPQSYELATVGGWVACRGAGQFSTRYGKVDDMVVGLEAVLADGTVLRTGGAPAAACGPDVQQLLIGSEGTLAVITTVWLRAHPLPAYREMAAFWFPDLSAGIAACGRILRRGATPAVMRLYDAIEAQRSHHGDGNLALLLALDEGDPGLVAATMAIVGDECRDAAAAGDEPVIRWLEHRNDTSALQSLTRAGFVVDTMEVAAPWSRLDAVAEHTLTALRKVPHCRAASCHLSHSYPDGACLYFTFGAAAPAEAREATYEALWNAGQRAALAAGANLSHHHGIGLNRARFMAEAMGPTLGVLQAVKDALDPHGVLNPGKMGLVSPFGEVPWP